MPDQDLQRIEQAIRENEHTLSQLKSLLKDMKSAERRTAEQMSHHAQLAGESVWSGGESSPAGS